MCGTAFNARGRTAFHAYWGRVTEISSTTGRVYPLQSCGSVTCMRLADRFH